MAVIDLFVYLLVLITNFLLIFRPLSIPIAIIDWYNKYVLA